MAGKKYTRPTPEMINAAKALGVSIPTGSGDYDRAYYIIGKELRRRARLTFANPACEIGGRVAHPKLGNCRIVKIDRDNYWTILRDVGNKTHRVHAGWLNEIIIDT